MNHPSRKDNLYIATGPGCLTELEFVMTVCKGHAYGTYGTSQMIKVGVNEKCSRRCWKNTEKLFLGFIRHLGLLNKTLCICQSFHMLINNFMPLDMPVLSQNILWSHFTNYEDSMAKYIHCFVWDLITHPWANFTGSLAKPLMKLKHGTVITSPFLWM